MPPQKPSKPAKRKTAARTPASAKEQRKAAPSRPTTAKPARAKKAAPVETPAEAGGIERYWEGVGRRKTAVARVRLYTRGDKGVIVNARPLSEYFHYPHLERIATDAIILMNVGDRFRITVKVNGSGPHAQAEAIRHGSARALVLFNPDFRKRLKRAGLLTRDPRMKERKKFGLKKARKAPQWAKR